MIDAAEGIERILEKVIDATQQPSAAVDATKRARKTPQLPSSATMTKRMHSRKQRMAGRALPVIPGTAQPKSTTSLAGRKSQPQTPKGKKVLPKPAKASAATAKKERPAAATAKKPGNFNAVGARKQSDVATQSTEPAGNAPVPSSLPVHLAKAEVHAERFRQDEMEQKKAEALSICDTDILEYGLIWEDVVRHETPDLVELERNVDRLGGMMPAAEPRQPVDIDGVTDTTSAKYFTCLNMALEEHDAVAFDGVQAVAATQSLEFHAGPPKKRDRAYEKAKLAYNRDYSQLKDLRRASIVCPNIGALITLLLALIDAGIDICRVSLTFPFGLFTLLCAADPDVAFNVANLIGLSDNLIFARVSVLFVACTSDQEPVQPQVQCQTDLRWVPRPSTEHKDPRNWVDLGTAATPQGGRGYQMQAMRGFG